MKPSKLLTTFLTLLISLGFVTGGFAAKPSYTVPKVPDQAFLQQIVKTIKKPIPTKVQPMPSTILPNPLP
jgi:hypothetical protein